MCDRQRDSLALVSFYNSTNGPMWNPAQAWNLSFPMTQWAGVKLTSEGCVEVVDLDGAPDFDYETPLFGLDLSGTLPPEIGLLSELKSLILTNNRIGGEIPQELGQLTNLEFLYLGNNNFTGTVPASIENISNLSHLVISGNELNGVILGPLGELQRLRIFDLSNNNLTGEIPPTFRNLGLLEELYLNDNNLTGSIPGILDMLSRLKAMDLSNNMLSDCFPEGLMVHCSFVNANQNPLLPWQGDFIQFCNNEEQIGAPCNDGDPNTSLDQITENCGCLGTNFNSCRLRDSLTLVDIYNSFGGNQWTIQWDFNAPINTWHGVRLNGDGCVDGLDMDSQADFVHSNTGNNLIGDIPITINNLRKLKDLIIVGDNSESITGLIPDNLSELTELETLIISQCNLSDEIPEWLTQLKSLEILDLSANNLEGRIQSELSQLTKLKELLLWGNNLEGIIPSDLSLLTELQYLGLSNNNLSGEIPGELGDLQNLVFFRLEGNNLNGCFDENLSKLCHLTTVDYGHCGLGDQLICQYDMENPRLPWRGDFVRFCDGEAQEDVLCDDLDPLTDFDIIKDCICRGTPKPEVSCRERDSLVLVNIYNETGGESWDLPWNLSQTIDLWSGVELNDSECVESLILSENNLVNRLPADIANLSELITLDLSNNELDGNVNLELRSLTNLEFLDLSSNNYGGEIPVDIYSLGNIKYLDLSDNNLTGLVNGLLTTMNNLEIVNLSNNDFLGCLDEELKELCDIDFILLGNGRLPWAGDFSKFCEGLDQNGAPCQDRFDTTIEDSINDLCECKGICIKPNAGLDTVATICHGETLDLTPFITGETTGTFLAQGGNGLVDVGGSLTADFYRVGANRIAYQVPGETGDCRSSDQALIDVNVKPSPYFDFVGDTIVCDDGTTNLTVSFDGPLTYQWSDNSTDDELFIDQSGTYGLTVTSSDNACSATNSVSVDIVSTYTIDIIGSASICPDDVYAIEVDTELEYDYEWSTGSTDSSIKPESPGTFAVTVTDTNGCEASDEIILQDLEEASIQFTNISAICVGDTASLGITNGTFEKYTWSTGETTPEIEINTPDTYSVTVENGDGCEGIASIEIGGIDAISVSLNGPIAVCNDQTYTISLTAGTYESYAWSTGAETPTIDIDSPDTYFVTVTDASGCTAISSLEVKLAEPFDIQIEGPSLTCRDDLNILSVSDGPFMNYEWSTGDRDSTITVVAAGEYLVTVTNEDGCIASNSFSVFYYEQEEVEIIGPEVVCEGDPFSLSVGDSFPRYNWSTGSEEPFVNVSEVGTYFVTVTDSNSCDIIDSIEVALPEEANIQFTDITAICAGDTVSLGITSGTFDTYQWSTGETTPEILVDTPDLYSVTIVGDSGCEISASIELGGLDAFAISLDGPSQVCNQQTYTVSVATGTYESYSWSTGAESSTIDIDSPGDYIVTVTDENDCTAISALSVDLAEEFEIEIDAPNLICRNDNIILSIDGEAIYSEYLWSTGSRDSTILIGTAEDYYVTVTDNDGCSSSTSIVVSYYPDAEVNIVGPEVVCGDPFSLSVDDSFLGYLWSTGAEDPSIDLMDIGTYTVTVTDNNNCDIIESVQVTLAEMPTARADRFSIPIEVGTTSIDVAGNDQLSQDWFVEIIEPPLSGELIQVGRSVFNYTTVENQSLAESFTYRLCSTTCPDLCSEAQVQLQLKSVLDDCDDEAAITPNGDGVNDFFVTCIDDLAQRYPENTLAVYNRWGQQLYTASPYDNDWNGMVDGKPLPQSTYYFILRLKNGSSLELGGSILLIR